MLFGQTGDRQFGTRDFRFMLFTSNEFLVLLFLTFILYYLPALRAWQVSILILSSFVFYAWTDPTLLLLLLASIGINSLASYQVAHARSPGGQRAWAIAGVVVNLAILAAFKYGGLFARLVSDNAGALPSPVDRFLSLVMSLPLPIGISFYTFEGISLVVDTWRRDSDKATKAASQSQWEISRAPWRHCQNVALFIAFFPHLIAGPVLKAKSFFPQLMEKRLSDINLDCVFRSLVTGYFLKVFVADNLHNFTFSLQWPHFQGLPPADCLVLLLGYSMQIFADFAGYSLIAVGLGALFGYELMQNFDFPYVSRSLAEFWRRWHISLSTWLRDYLYFPLGGNRHGPLRTYFNLFTVMTLGGLWHGASWSYAFWGMFHGIGLIIERMLGLERAPDPEVARAPLLRFVIDAFRVLVVFLFVTTAWAFFILPEFQHALRFFSILAGGNWGRPRFDLLVPVAVYSLPVLLYHAPRLPCFQGPAESGFRSLCIAAWQRARFAVYGAMLLLLLLDAGSSQAFIYFQF